MTKDKDLAENEIRNDLTNLKKRFSIFGSEIDNELRLMDEIYHAI